MSRWPEARVDAAWYVKAQGRVWGPYPDRRIEAFVYEQRVTAATLLSPAPDGPFSPAGLQDGLRRLFMPETTGPDPFHAAPLAASVPAGPIVEHAGASRPLLVFAVLETLDVVAFESALAIQGVYERLGAGLWLVRARLGATAMRNALSRRLRGGDTLVVVEASLEQAAWFNLDHVEDRKLRALWAG